MKRIPLNIKKYWCEIYIKAENKIEIRDKLIKAYPLRYKNYSNITRYRAHEILKIWVREYNLGIMGTKKLGRPRKMREIDKVYRRKGRLGIYTLMIVKYTKKY